MNVGIICQRKVATIEESADLAAAAELMREKHVGFLVVVQTLPGDRLEQAELLRPVGVVTDRDLVVSVIAKGADPRALSVSDVMTQQPVTVREDDAIDTVLVEMRRNGVRRVPVLGRRGQLIGVVSMDDILEAIANELTNVVGSIRNEQRIEATLRP